MFKDNDYLFIQNEKKFEEYPKIIYHEKNKYLVNSKEEEEHVNKNVIKVSSKKSK